MNVTSPIRNINQSNSSVTDDLQIHGSTYPLILTSRDSYNTPSNTSSIVKSAAKARSLQDEERIIGDDTDEANFCGMQNNFHQDPEMDESTDQWRCKVCHVPLNSEKVIQQHSNGRAHHNKKKLVVVAMGPCYTECGIMKQKFVHEEPVPKALVDDHAGIQALSQFTTPKQTLNTLLQSSNLPNSNKLVRYETRRIKEVYQTVLRLNWPQEFAITGLGRKKVDSERAAAALACVQLQKLGVLQNDGSPSNGTTTKNPSAIKQHLQKNSLPEFVQLPNDLKQRILTLHTSQEESLEEGHNGMRFMDEFDPRLEEERIRTTDIITGRELQEISEESLNQRSEFLYNRWQQTRWNQNEAALTATDLPIVSERERILSLLENNRVVVLCGETGCGKTTQVPQFILDSYLEKREGAKCNIVVTQPRRISAISVAERVTVERGERIGDTVGYQVRLKSHLPHPNGCILYCTTGILLKKLQSNPTLEGISHIVVDEVHERDINIDFLLVLLKSALKSNPNLTLLLMSASINAEMFSRYFDGCPLISVPGRMYQVQEYFLPEVMDRLQEAGIRHHRQSVNSGDEAEKPETDHDLVVDVVKYLDQVKPPGAILVFLPGWQDIKTVNDRLRNTLRKDGEARYIFPVHSSIPLSEQQQIFQRPPDGRRKIVLATNIAETSITIDDVVYVVNTGSHKEQRYKMNLGVSCLDLFWVSKANIIQRKGRAGRCQPGECYHLFKHETFEMLDSYEMPEILRVPLEQIVIMSKVHGPHLPAVEFQARPSSHRPSALVNPSVIVVLNCKL
ncbi:putative ATP-dependent RNA helicase DHX30 [Apostichopus japonicus]|uniref:RNA helicase n=1 Tax=Stichopus japonicus TaxID=307972 RepID=A0A2G8KFR8_STIJA|nr:putative ATP-dependent RNA helicase DHX30 [Apostichopus japonicus]